MKPKELLNYLEKGDHTLRDLKQSQETSRPNWQPQVTAGSQLTYSNLQNAYRQALGNAYHGTLSEIFHQ